MERRIRNELQSLTRRRAALLDLIEALEAFGATAWAGGCWRHPACHRRTVPALRRVLAVRPPALSR